MAVTLRMEGDVGIIRLDDGDKNVINHAVLDELEAAWAQAEAEAKAIVLCGREGSFCAGYDLSVMTGEDDRAAAELGRRGGVFAHKLFGSARPLVGVSTGHAFTIGALWLACCDVRIGEAGRFKYGMTEVALNVGFSPWPLVPLQERLEPRHLIPAVLHARIYPPEEALEAGFIDQLVPSGTGLEQALETAAGLAQLPGRAYAASKQVLRREGLAIMAEDLGFNSGG